MFIFSLFFTGSIVFYARFFLFPHQVNLFPIWLYLIHLLVDFSNRSASFHGNAKALRNHLFILLNKETLLYTIVRIVWDFKKIEKYAITNKYYLQ